VIEVSVLLVGPFFYLEDLNQSNGGGEIVKINRLKDEELLMWEYTWNFNYLAQGKARGFEDLNIVSEEENWLEP